MYQCCGSGTGSARIGIHCRSRGTATMAFRSGSVSQIGFDLHRHKSCPINIFKFREQRSNAFSNHNGHQDPGRLQLRRVNKRVQLEYRGSYLLFVADLRSSDEGPEPDPLGSASTAGAGLPTKAGAGGAGSAYPKGFRSGSMSQNRFLSLLTYPVQFLTYLNSESSGQMLSA